jgi:hypothetical protein
MHGGQRKAGRLITMNWQHLCPKYFLCSFSLVTNYFIFNEQGEPRMHAPPTLMLCHAYFS